MPNIINKKAKIRWLCRRGMLELDLILTRFYNQNIDQLNEQQLIAVEELLNYPDPDLYAWLMGYEKPAEDVADVINLIQFCNSPK